MRVLFPGVTQYNLLKDRAKVITAVVKESKENTDVIKIMLIQKKETSESDGDE